MKKRIKNTMKPRPVENMLKVKPKITPEEDKSLLKP